MVRQKGVEIPIRAPEHGLIQPLLPLQREIVERRRSFGCGDGLDAGKFFGFEGAIEDCNANHEREPEDEPSCRNEIENGPARRNQPSRTTSNGGKEVLLTVLGCCHNPYGKLHRCCQRVLGDGMTDGKYRDVFIAKSLRTATTPGL